MNRSAILPLAAAAILLHAACGGGTEPAPAPGKAAAPAKPAPAGGAPEMPASHPPVGSAAQPATQPGMPEGHPSVGGSPHGDVVPPAPGSGAGEKGLTWKAPEGWTAQTPSSSMRKAQYVVPGAGGDAECIVFYFGPGQGGDAQSNAERWAGQFAAPDGSKVPPTTKEITAGGMKVLSVEVAGTYGAGQMMGGQPTEPRADFMLLGAIVEGPDANWFFKLTGPKATVEAARPAFDAMIQSVAPGGQDV